MSAPFPSACSPHLQARIEAGLATVGRHSGRLLADLGRVESDWKKDGSRVTETDHAISQGILADLAAAFPEDQGLSEELLVDEPVAVTREFAWVLDPIDGTNNFAAGLVQCAISLALFQHGRPVYGIVYDASRRCVIQGGPGIGLWDGGRKAAPYTGRLDASSKIGFHSPRHPERYPGHGEAIITASKIRGMGSSTLHLAYTAVGLLDGVVDHNVKIWDIAAGMALMAAARGEMRYRTVDPLPLTSFDVEMPSIVYVAGNSAMCDDLSAILDNVERGRNPP